MSIGLNDSFTLPERPDWDRATVLAVQAQNQRQLDLASMLRNVLDRLGTNLYSGGPLRSVPELLQNAQDAHATKVVFVLDEDAVLVYNDGDPFAAYQVEDICSIAQSRKSELEIGWMGLGFKSVFTISEHPQVTSGRFNFEFESLVVPRPVDDAIESLHLPSFSAERGAWFRLPFKAKGQRDVILNGWRQLSPHLLLFLPQLERVDFIDVRKGSQWFFEKRTVDEGMVDLVSSGAEPTTWRVYHRQLAEMAEEAGHKKRVPSISLAFPHRIDESLKSEALYCYLPTQITTGLNFLVHADFGLDISRESLLDDEDNRTILQAAGKLASEAIKEMLSEPAIGASALDFIPETIDVQHHLVQILEHEIIDCLRSTRFLIAEGGIRVSPKSAVIGEPRIKRLFTGQDLRRLFKRKVHFLRDDLVTRERQRRILIRLGVEQVTVNHVISLLHTKETQQRQAEWFLDCYDYLHQVWRRAVPDPRTPHQVAWIDELKRFPCVLTTLKRPRLVPPGGFAPGEVVSYSAGQGASELGRTFKGRGLFLVHRSLWLSGGRVDDAGEPVDELEARRERVKEFLCVGLGVRRTADVTTVIEGIILPRLQQTSRLKPDEVLRLTDYVRRNLDAYRGRVERERPASRMDPLRRLREGLMLRCRTWKKGRRVLIWCSPGRSHLGHEYTEDRELGDLFRGVDGVAFVSPDYLKVETDSEFKGRGRSRTRIPAWREFFREIGAHEHISVVQQRRERLDGNDSVFEWLSWPSDVPPHYRYDSSRHRLTDWVSEDLTGLLAHLDQLDIAPAIAKATLLWKHLERHWSEFASLVARYEYRYSTWYTSKQNTCTFKEQLRRGNWIANESKNGLFKPDQLHHPRNKVLLGDAVDYAAWRVPKQFADAIGLPYRVSGTDILDRLRSIRSRSITEWPALLESIGRLYHELVDLGISEEVQAAFAHERLVLAASSGGYAWFSSSQCLWADERERFFDLFGCLAPLYEEKLLSTFERLGITAKPTLYCVFKP